MPPVTGAARWATNHPFVNPVRLCAMLNGGNSLLYGTDCNSAYVRTAWCRRTVGYRLELNGKYYKVLHVRTTNYARARTLCEAEGGRLASAPYGLQENTAMGSFRAQMAGRGPETLMVNGTDAAREGVWVLPNGQRIYLLPS